MLEGITDFRVLSQAQVTRVADLLNEQLRQTLGFKTPKDQFMQLCAESYWVPLGTSPSEIGDVFCEMPNETGTYFEFSVNEKVALEVAT